MTPGTIVQLRAAPTVDLMTAARSLRLGRTKAYGQAPPAAVSMSGPPHRRHLPASPPPARSNSSVSLLTDR